MSELDDVLTDFEADDDVRACEALDLLHGAAFCADQNIFAGTYAALTGPTYETPAEIRAVAEYLASLP